MRRGAVLVTVAFLLGWPAALPARAHSSLVSSSPAAGSTVTTQPPEVTLTFAEVVRAGLSAVVVTGPGGTKYTQGAARAVDRTVHQPLRPLRSGTYQVAWRVVTADGHTLRGAYRFTASLPAALSPTPPSPTPAAPSPTRSTAGVAASRPDSGRRWPWAAVAGAVAGAALLVVLRARSRRARLRS